jgi:hypothetical protein
MVYKLLLKVCDIQATMCRNWIHYGIAHVYGIKKTEEAVASKTLVSIHQTEQHLIQWSVILISISLITSNLATSLKHTKSAFQNHMKEEMCAYRWSTHYLPKSNLCNGHSIHHTNVRNHIKSKNIKVQAGHLWNKYTRQVRDSENV